MIFKQLILTLDEYGHGINLHSENVQIDSMIAFYSAKKEYLH